jgi:hypothetical protein
VLTLNPGEPISGQIQAAGRTAEPFRGWIELTGKLERLRVMIGQSEPQPDPSPSGGESESS